MCSAADQLCQRECKEGVTGVFSRRQDPGTHFFRHCRCQLARDAKVCELDLARAGEQYICRYRVSVSFLASNDTGDQLRPHS